MEFQQRTTEWFRDRIGRWNASEIGNLMKRDRCGNFGDTALSYINGKKISKEPDKVRRQLYGIGYNG